MRWPITLPTGWSRRTAGADDPEIPGQARDDVFAAPSTGHPQGPAAPPQGAAAHPQAPTTTSSRRKPGSPPDMAAAVTLQAAALLLAYPEAELLDRLDVVESALSDASAVGQFAPVLAHLRSLPLGELQAFHVQEFDLSRRHALHLSYWTDGDTRRRGEVLAEVKGVYRDSGLLVDLGGELPDYLPIVLEFAVADPGRGLALLQRFRASVELIRLGMEKDGLPHACVLRAVCALLPGESPRSRAEVQAQFGEIQPVEFVGLNDVVRS